MHKSRQETEEGEDIYVYIYIFIYIYIHIKKIATSKRGRGIYREKKEKKGGFGGEREGVRTRVRESERASETGTNGV